MNAATTALDIVGKSVRVTRDELEVAMEAAGCDGRAIGSTISTLIRRGELAVDDEDRITLGDEEAIEKARQEREARKQGRDRPPPPRDEITPTQIRERIVAFVTECKHGVKARGVVEHMNGYTTEANVWYHLKQLVAHQQLRKAGQLYLPEHAKNAPVEPDLDATAPTAPIVDVAAVCAEAEELSRPEPEMKGKPEHEPVNMQPHAREQRAHERVRTIADVAAKHAATVPEAGGIQEAVANLGDIQIRIITRSAVLSARMLAAALAAIQP